jgi:hypothetical protein
VSPGQRDFFASDRDQAIREKIKRRDELAAQLNAVKHDLHELVADAKAVPVANDGSVFMRNLDDPEVVLFYSADKMYSLKISKPMLIEGLRKLGAI